MELPEKTKAKPGASSVEVGRFDVTSLYGGQYFLEIEATDLMTKQTSSVIQLFSIDNPEKVVVALEESKPAETNDELYSDSRYDIMVEEELDLEFEMAKYIADRKEKKTYKKLKITAKRDFLKEFWAKRDSDPSTELNEFRKDYLTRAKYVNETLGSMGAGWKTDRGRVILLYGLADEVERHTLTSQSKPYQIWRYFSVEGGVEFIFVDRQLFGNFQLVHSTARNEIRDQNWERWISPTKEPSQTILLIEQENAN
jgi:GWxTD domain-containing protein